MTYTQVSYTLKVGFFYELKTGRSDHPQTSRPAFLVDFSGVVQLKRPHRHPGNAHLII